MHSTILKFNTIIEQHSMEYHIARKFGGGLAKFGDLAVCLSTAKFKIRQNFYHIHIHMEIPYHTTKFKSANTVQHIVCMRRNCQI